VSGPDTADGGQHRAPAGLLEKLMAAVRPEFRAGILVFDPADPVFGGDACRVPQCGRTARAVGMCAMRTISGGSTPGAPIPVRSPPRTRRPGRGSGMRR
jgi:hypothetical protein